MRIVPVKALTTEMELAKPVLHNNNILLNTGISNLDKYKNKLLNYGINYVYINDQYSRDIIINDVIRDETRQRGRKLIKKTLSDIAKKNDVNMKEVTDFIFDMVTEIMSQDNVLVNLIDIKCFDTYTFSHSVNVAAISILIGQLMNIPQERLVKLGVGAILHDVGKILIPEEIINKPARLSSEEFSIIKDHPRLGYNYLKEFTDISAISRIVILSHHERIDGSGYPKGIDDDDIHFFAKIAAIADVFDALTTDRIYRKSWSINDVVDYLVANVNLKFDQVLVEYFVQNISLYPNGMTVLLSNGQKAIVKEQNKYFPLRPVVRVIEDKEGKPVKDDIEINLMDELDIVITDNL